MNKLLLIDDNPEIQAVNHEFLTQRGFAVDMAMNGSDAMAFLKNRTYDCIVLDVMMPDVDGYTLCAEARREFHTPIIFLSCLDSEADRIRGLMSGGDSYMTKPYSIKELAVNIHAQIRRNTVLSKNDSAIESPAPHVLYDRESRTVAIGGMNLVMSRGECELLMTLIARPNETVDRRTLLACVGGEENTLKVYIMRLRGRLEDEGLGAIENVFGEGYRYLPPAKGGRI